MTRQFLLYLESNDRLKERYDRKALANITEYFIHSPHPLGKLHKLGPQMSVSAPLWDVVGSYK